MCASCYMLPDKFYVPPPARCSSCGELCNKQIGKWAAVHYGVKGYPQVCCKCFLSITKQGKVATK